MANHPLRPCNHPGCVTLTAERYCERHRSLHIPKDSRSEAAKERHRMYVRPVWQRLRQEQFLREPWCRVCASYGRRVKATDVDHIVPHGGDERLFTDKTNLQSLCHACHSAKTRRENRKNMGVARG